MKKRDIRMCQIILFLLGFLLWTTGCGEKREEFLENVLVSEMEDSSTEDPPSEKVEQSSHVVTSGNSDTAEERIQEAVDLKQDSDRQAADFYVDVCGAVMHPGVYKLSAGSRIYEAIEMAGGFTAEAASEQINQAQFLTDEEQIYVPTHSEVESHADFPGSDAIREGGSSQMSGQSYGTSSNGKININTADAGQLMALPGIGETRAGMILSYREAHGPFASVEEIMKVEGIKEGTYSKIKDQIAVE